jgi:hypothetical protein
MVTPLRGSKGVSFLIFGTPFQKKRGRPGFPRDAPFVLAISRILSPPLSRLVTIISLPPPEGDWPTTRAGARAASATITRRLPCLNRRRFMRGRARRRASCYVLHRRRFFVPRALLRGRWALTPPFHPYPRLLLRKIAGGLFSVTLSVATDFRPPRPWILHGLLSGGVRTFLSRANRERPSANAGKLPSGVSCARTVQEIETEAILLLLFLIEILIPALGANAWRD